MPPHADAIRIELKFLRLSAEKTDRTLTIVKRLRELSTPWCQPIVDAHTAVAALDQRHELIGATLLRARSPAAAMDIHDDRQRFGGQLFGTLDVQLEFNVTALA